MKKITKNLLLGLGGISLLGGVVVTTISCSSEEKLPTEIFTEESLLIRPFLNKNDEWEALIRGYAENTNISPNLIIKEKYRGLIVTEISANAFEKKMLTSLVLPNSIKVIGEYAFRENNITDPFNLPSSLETIGYGAFQNNKIKTLVIPSSVKTIVEGAFDTNNIESLIIKSGVKTIGLSAFGGNKIKNIIVPDSIETIGNGAFINNSFASGSQIIVPDKFRATIEEWKRIGLPENLYPGPATTSNNEEGVISPLREENYAVNDSKPNTAK